MSITMRHLKERKFKCGIVEKQQGKNREITKAGHKSTAYFNFFLKSFIQSLS